MRDRRRSHGPARPRGAPPTWARSRNPDFMDAGAQGRPRLMARETAAPRLDRGLTAASGELRRVTSRQRRRVSAGCAGTGSETEVQTFEVSRPAEFSGPSVPHYGR